MSVTAATSAPQTVHFVVCDTVEIVIETYFALLLLLYSIAIITILLLDGLTDWAGNEAKHEYDWGWIWEDGTDG